MTPLRMSLPPGFRPRLVVFFGAAVEVEGTTMLAPGQRWRSHYPPLARAYLATYRFERLPFPAPFHFAISPLTWRPFPFVSPPVTL